METSQKRKAIEASAFVLFGFGLSQVIRLAGNIALTRLLMPELFGLLNIARVFVVGIWLFSDIGPGPGDRPKQAGRRSGLSEYGVDAPGDPRRDNSGPLRHHRVPGFPHL